MKDRKRLYLILFIVAAVSFFFFRFFNLDKRILFDWDQETLSFQLKKILVEHRPILIGHRATDVTGFYFGPYFEYLFVPFYFFSRLHPIGLLPFIIVINAVLFMVSFYVIKKLFNRDISLVFLIFWALNPLLIVYDITVWAPILIPVGIMLTWFILWRLYNKPSYLNFLSLGMVLGFFSQIHSLFFFSDLFAAVFIIVAFVLIKNFKQQIFPKLMTLGGAFIIFLAPLVVFDLRHQFLNSKLFLGYFANRVQGTPHVYDSLQVFSNFVKPLIFSNNLFLGGLFYLAIMVILIYLVKTKKKFYKIFYLTSLIVWVITALVYFRYTRRPSEYYFLYLYPIIVIALLDFFYKLKKQLLIILCFIFFVFNFKDLTAVTNSYPRGLSYKDKTIKILKENMNGRPYNLAYGIPWYLETGYSYLLDYYGMKPTGKPTDPMVIIRMPAKKGDIMVNKVGISIPKELRK